MGCTRQSEAVRATALDGSWLTFGLRRQAGPSLVGSLSFTFKKDPLDVMGNQESPFKQTIVLELAQGDYLYVPTLKAFEEGSYETIDSVLAPGGGEAVVEKVLLNSGIGEDS